MSAELNEIGQIVGSALEEMKEAKFQPTEKDDRNRDVAFEKLFFGVVKLGKNYPHMNLLLDQAKDYVAKK